MSQRLKGIKGLLNFRDKKSRRVTLLVMSSMFIAAASILAYGGIVVEQPLNVQSTGTTPGFNSPMPSSFSTGSIFILLALGVTVGLAVFGFIREAYRRLKAPDEQVLPDSVTITSIDHEWEEAPKKDGARTEQPPS